MPTFTVLFFESWFDTFDRGSILLLSLPWSFLGELWIHCVVSVRFVPYNTHLDHMYFTCSKTLALFTGGTSTCYPLHGQRQKKRPASNFQTVECRPLRLTDETDEFISNCLSWSGQRGQRCWWSCRRNPTFRGTKLLFVWMTLQKN